MASGVVSAVGAIAKILGAVSTIRDLLAGNASATITVDDLRLVVRGEHARFFTTIAFADIETFHNRFYTIWLPSVVDRSNITSNDVTAGALRNLFQDLRDARNRLQELMNQLRHVFRQHLSDLHIDELMRGVLGFMHVIGLLLHMHAVYAELHRIQVDVASLDHRDLLTDTLSVLQYIRDGNEALDMILPTLRDRRLGTVGEVRQTGGGIVNPPRWVFQDTYSPLQSTTSDIVLSVPPQNLTNASQSLVRALRERHIENVIQRMRVVVTGPAEEVLRELSGLESEMRERERVQRAAGAQ